MEFEKIYNKGQATIFRNKYLEFFTKAHPLLIWGIYLPVIAIFLYYSFAVARIDTISGILTFAAGIFFWTLFEYLVHRFAFHFIPKSQTGKRLVYVIHGNHHEYPRDRQRLFMPPLPSIIIAAVIFTVMYSVGIAFSIREYVFTFFPGFVLGYLLYGSMHYAIHAWNPPFRWMKPLWRNHHLHHYKDGLMGFGVSTTFWDRIFGTMYTVKQSKIPEAKPAERNAEGG